MKKFLQVVGGITCVSVICSLILIAISIYNCDEEECDVDYIDDDDFEFHNLNAANE